MPTPILGQPELTAFQLRNYLYQINPSAPDYTTCYISLGHKYGVRGDIAFCQTLLETGYFRFGGAVLPTQNNFAGLGATGGTARGVVFPTPQAGIEAQMQHLYAYATTYPLPANTVQIDPRFQLVNRGSAPNWEDLSGRWAADPEYGNKILALWQELRTTQSALTPFPNSDATPPSPQPSTFPASSDGTTAPVPNAPIPEPSPVEPGHVIASDVPTDAWYAPYVQQIIQLGVMRGDPNGRFEPERPATRAELAVALYQLYHALSQRT
ncbi:MAG: S-layer homology domain-containing protein [Tumebacillaceae bacterium]